MLDNARKKGDLTEKKRQKDLLAGINDKDTQIRLLKEENRRLQKEAAELDREIERLTHVEQAYKEILNAKWWRITAPFRFLIAVIRMLPVLLQKSIRILKQEGPKALLKRVLHYRLHTKPEGTIDYNTYILQHTPSKRELQRQSSVKFKKDITFSVLVPLYNTPEKFLREMIESVLNQSYQKWELCMADGSDSAHGDVERIAAEYTKKDTRIKYLKLEENKGIAGNTNACIDMSTGDYLVLFDHDDLLASDALFKNMERIENEDADFLYSDEMTFENKVDNCLVIHFKPDFSPETLCGHNYICHLTVYSRNLFKKVGYFSNEYDGSQDYDMALRLTEQAQKIVHIPEVLYYWRSHPQSVAGNINAKSYCLPAAHKAIAAHLERIGLKGTVEDGYCPTTYRVCYELDSEPLVSILIPNKDMVKDLGHCIESIYESTTYPNFEIIVIENNSTEAETFDFYNSLQQQHENLRVVEWKEQGFNYSAINNFGATYAKGAYFLLLNNDMEVITPDWIQELLMFAQKKNVGIVGAKLYYPDDTIQHAGVIFGLGGVAGHVFHGCDRESMGYMHRLVIAQNLSCVTAACLLTKRSVWEAVGGLDEGFKVAFNDVDYCTKVRKAGYEVIFTPFAELYHHESKSRGYEDTPEKIARFDSEIKQFCKKWETELEAGDPYYNPNLTLDYGDFSIAEQSRG